MADAKLRELERRARTGCPQAEAEQLLARVRAGTLSRERLELAAWGGHEPARLSIGLWTPWPLGKRQHRTGWDSLDAQTLGQWLHSLWWVFRNAGPGPAGWITFRAAVEASSAALFALVTQEPTQADLGLIVRTARQLLGAPCQENLALLRATVARERRDAFVPSWALLDGCFTDVRGLVSVHGCEAVVFFSASRAREPVVRQAIREALTCWALGGSP